MARDQIGLIDEHPKEGCGAGPNIFSSDALALDLTPSVFSLFPFPICNINTVAQTVQHELCTSIQKVMTLQTFHGVCHPCIFNLRLLPSHSLYLPLFVPLFGCTFIC